MGTAQRASNLREFKDTCKRHYCDKLETEKSLHSGKERDLVIDEIYSLVVDGISSTKRRGSNTVELDHGSTLFFAGVESTKFAQVVVRIFAQLAGCVGEWIPVGGRVACWGWHCQTALCVWHRYTAQIQAYSTLNSWMKPSDALHERLKLTIPQSVSTHTLETTPSGHGSVWTVGIVMLTNRQCKLGSCCNRAGTTHCASSTLSCSTDLHKYIWCGDCWINGHWFLDRFSWLVLISVGRSCQKERRTDDRSP